MNNLSYLIKNMWRKKSFSINLQQFANYLLNNAKQLFSDTKLTQSKEEREAYMNKQIKTKILKDKVEEIKYKKKFVKCQKLKKL